MSPYVEIFKEYTKTIQLFGRDHEVKVSIKLEHDEWGHDLIDDMDAYTEKERQEMHDDLNNGRLDCIGVIVEVSCQYFTGTNSIWGSLVKSRDDIEVILKDYTLVEIAIKEHELEANRYKNFFDKLGPTKIRGL